MAETAGQGDNAIGAPDLREAAIRLLARREHGRRELADKLERKNAGVDPGVLHQVLDELAREGLQSDVRFAESFARQRAGKRFGPVRIRAELRQRGIDEGVADAAIDALEVDFFELAAETYVQRYGRSGPPGDMRERARRHQALLRRGFAHDHLREIDELSAR